MRLPVTHASALFLATLASFIVPSVTNAIQLGESSAVETSSLRGNDVPEYFLARTFLASVHDATLRSAQELDQLLAPYGLAEGSEMRTVLVREATLVADATDPEQDTYEPSDFSTQADFEEHNFRRVKETARIVGESWGRFLAEVSASDRDAEGLVDAIRYQYRERLALVYGGEGAEEALDRILALHASFLKAKLKSLREATRERR